MQKKIFKYEVLQQDYFALVMPKGAEILTAQTQFGVPQMWALVEPTAGLEIRKFRLAGTGHPIDEDNLRYIGTFQMLGGNFIGHLFEVIK